jgi:hypothetical protein
MNMIDYTLSNMDIATCFLSIPLLIYIFFPRSIVLSAPITVALLSPLGIVLLFSISVSLFLFTNIPFVCLFIVAIYEMLRRCSSKHMDPTIRYSQENRDAVMKEMNGPRVITLEEDTINQMDPSHFSPSPDATVAAASSFSINSNGYSSY